MPKSIKMIVTVGVFMCASDTYDWFILITGGGLGRSHAHCKVG